MHQISPPSQERLRRSWLRPAIEAYLDWLVQRGSSPSTVRRRVPRLLQFGDFAQKRGVVEVEQLPGLVEPFVDVLLSQRRGRLHTAARLQVHRRELRKPVAQLLEVALPDGASQAAYEPAFFGQAEGLFASLRDERGLREATVELYRGHLRHFEDFLVDEGLTDVREMDVHHLDGFILLTRRRLCPRALVAVCSALRHLLRWLYRAQRIPTDLSVCVEAPHAYRLSELPRSISRARVEATLAVIDRGSLVGIHDYAMLLLLVLYGLRAREVAALTLDDLDWRQSRLRVPGRKAGHSTLYPLSSLAGEALIAHLRLRHPSSVRQVFLMACAPRKAVSHRVVSQRASHYLRKAGVEVRRPGSHTLRHSCAQRLVEADFSLKVIGDYLGHRSPTSTEIYTKVDVETLRQVALGNGEVVL